MACEQRERTHPANCNVIHDKLIHVALTERTAHILHPFSLCCIVCRLLLAERFWRIVQMSEKQLPANPAVGRLKHMVEEVKLTVPVVADLRSGTLMDRHWEVLDDVLNMDVREQGAVTFKQMMEVTLRQRKKCTPRSILRQTRERALLLYFLLMKLY